MSLASPVGLNGLGDRRTKVAIQAETRVNDAFGQPIPTWATVATVRARKRQLTGREVFHANSIDALADFVLETHWPQTLVTVTETMRCLIDGVYFSISRVDNLEDANRTLLIYITKSLKQPTS
jgi:SPP1 family predicted phage head-tail adaptor